MNHRSKASSAIAAIPHLSYRHAFVNRQAGFLVSNVIPGGGAVDDIVRDALDEVVARGGHENGGQAFLDHRAGEVEPVRHAANAEQVPGEAASPEEVALEILGRTPRHRQADEDKRANFKFQTSFVPIH